MKAVRKYNFFLLILLLMTGPAFLFCGCGGSDNDGNSGTTCDCEGVEWTEENGLFLTFESQSTENPAIVSMLFKVETEGGVPLTGLTPDNFRIYEDGETISRFESQQTIRHEPGKFRSHILLLLDLSGSILESENLTVLKEAARNFIHAVMPAQYAESYREVDMAIWWFDGAAQAHQLVSFDTETTRLISGIDNIHEQMSEDSSTNLYGAAIQAVDLIADKTGQFGETVAVGSVVIFTDGKDQASRRTKEDALAAVNNADNAVSVYTIGLGGEIDSEVLEDIGRDGFLYAEDVEALVPKFEEIAGTIREDINSHYLLKYCSPKRSGAHDLTVEAVYNEMTGSITTCFCADGFTGGCNLTEN